MLNTAKTEVSFYEVIGDDFEKIACSLIEKCYHTNCNTLVVTEDEGMQEMFNKMLWTYKQKSFVPHGSLNDPRASDQPVLITYKDENLNNSTLLVLIGGAYINVENFHRVFIIFSAESERQSKLAQSIHSTLSNHESDINFYKKEQSGPWEKLSSPKIW